MTTEGVDRIAELEACLRELIEWLDRTDRNGCAHTEHARKVLDRAETKEVKHCSDFTGAPPCCDPCHEDEAMGYEMVELYEDSDGVRAIVCCAVLRHIEDSKQDSREA